MTIEDYCQNRKCQSIQLMVIFNNNFKVYDLVIDETN
jgi:hypothetical protein